MTCVLGVAEHRRGEIRDVTYEVLAAGRELAAARDEEFHLAIVGGQVERFAERLDRDGVDVIYTADVGTDAQQDVTVQALQQIAVEHNAGVVLAPHSVSGLGYAPAIANRLDCPLVTDVLDLFDKDGRLYATREMYGGKVKTTLTTDWDQVIVTVRPGEWDTVTAVGDATIQPFDVAIDHDAVRTQVIDYETPESGDVDITAADVLVAVGRGIEDEENLDLIFNLADVLDATVAASRPIVDKGWLPPDRQVGQSGKVVSPEVYIAIGISGAVQHVTGMEDSETVIAINTDPNAPIMDVSDFAVHDDLFTVVPAMIDTFSE